jgi:hypothetical protein
MDNLGCVAKYRVVSRSEPTTVAKFLKVRFVLKKMGLRWWRDVLIRNQTKQYLEDR